MSKIQGTLAQWRDRLRRKELSPAELVNLMADAIEADRTTNAYISFDREAALHAAAGADISGPLAGIPIAVKDNINVLGQPTRCASRLLSPYVAPYDATSIRLLKEAGGIPLGRTNMDEFAMGASGENSAYGITRNPEAPDRIPGGSSSGSAAAVASATAVAALGSDTGGSIRQPAGHCGIVGLKPTYGRVSRYGLVAFASSLDQIGPLTKNVADNALVMNAIAGKDFRDATSLDRAWGDFAGELNKGVKGLKIALPKQYFGEGISPEVKGAVLEAAKRYEDLGAFVEEADLPALEYALPAYYVISSAEASSNLARFDGVKYGFRAEDYEDIDQLYLATRTQGFGKEVKRRIMLGSFVLSAGYYDAYYKKALQVRTLIQREFDRALESCDLILAPVAPTTAYKIGEKTSDPLQMYLGDVCTVPVNIAGLPALSLPCGEDRDGLPVGMQLIGKAYSEALLYRAGYAFEQAGKEDR